jgi:Endonuclease-reverse transcriptase
MVDKIIQWNCRGLKPNLLEIQHLISDMCPMAFCLQETYVNDSTIKIDKNFNLFIKNGTTTGGRIHGRVAILVHKLIPHSEIHLTTALQAVAVRLTMHRVISLCSLYLPPSTAIDILELEDLLRQLPSPAIILGDFNAHSPVWGCNDLDNKGKLIEDFIANNNLFLLNGKTETYIHPATGSKSAIDLSITTSNIGTDFSWSIHDDLCGSDHFPLIVQGSIPVPTRHVARWKLRKADWDMFREECQTQINTISQNKTIEQFTSTLSNIAANTIPKTKDTTKRHRKPWFTDECKQSIINRKKALRDFKNNHTVANLNKYKITQAQTRRTLRTAKKTSWQNYVQTLSHKATTKEV